MPNSLIQKLIWDEQSGSTPIQRKGCPGEKHAQAFGISSQGCFTAQKPLDSFFADIILIASSLILAQMDEDIKAEPLDDERLAMFTSYNILRDNISANEAGKH